MNRTIGLLTVLTLAVALPAQVQVFAMDGHRTTTGLFYFDRAAGGSPGQIFLHYGQPEWKVEYEEFVTSDKAETLRLGSDWWTTLDTTVPLTMGQRRIPAGIYYLGLHKTAKGQWQLMLLDPQEVRAKKAHPGMTPNLTAKLNVDLNYRKAAKSMDKLTITIQRSKLNPKIGSLVIHWSNHHLQAQVEPDFGTGKAMDAGTKKEGMKKGMKEGMKDKQ